MEVRAVCPACGSITQSGRVDPKFYYNVDKDVGHCFHCEFSGPMGDDFVNELNVIDISERRQFDPRSYDALEPLSEEALRYLTKRFPGVEQSQYGVFKLRYSRQHHAIAIPSYDKSNKLQGVKYRLIAPSGDLRYMSETGSQFGGFWLDGKTDKLLIVEGEFDAMSAKLMGFNGTVLALQTNKLSQDTVQRVRGFKNIFTCLDQDDAGAEGTSQVRELIGDRFTAIKLSGVKDLNELLQKGIHEGNKFLKQETRTELERSTTSLAQSIPELVEFISDQRNTRGDQTGWKALDHLFGGGFRAAEMTVINAFAKTGKSSFINNIVHNLASSGKRVAMASFEMDPARSLYPSLLSIAGQTNIRRISNKADLSESVELLQTECSYLANIVTLKRFGITPWREVEEWAALMKEQHNIDYLVLDHAGFMVEKMTDAEENQNLAKSIKKLTLTLGLHILVVVQAPKTKDGLSIQTSYGGLAWGMNADNFLILERDKDDENLLKVRLEAARYPGAIPSSIPVHLYYDRETCTLSE